MKPKFFSSAAQFHSWLEKNHEDCTELFVGFHKKASGKKSITYPEALDEALCFGWIDGVRNSIDETSYMIRFTPRKPKSNWSLVNLRHIERLKKQDRIKPAGHRALALRDPKRTGIYSFENVPRELSAEYLKTFQQNRIAWEFFQAQPPFFRKTVAFWVMSAKKEETRIRRLEQLIASSEQGERVGVVVAKPKK